MSTSEELAGMSRFILVSEDASTGRPNPEEVPAMSARSVGVNKGHLTVLITELDKIVKHKNFSKGRDCIKGGESSSQFQWFTIAKIEL